MKKKLKLTVRDVIMTAVQRGTDARAEVSARDHTD